MTETEIDDLLDDLAEVVGDLIPLTLDRGSINLAKRLEHDDPLTLFTARDVIKMVGTSAGSRNEDGVSEE